MVVVGQYLATDAGVMYSAELLHFVYGLYSDCRRVSVLKV